MTAARWIVGGCSAWVVASIILAAAWAKGWIRVVERED